MNTKRINPPPAFLIQARVLAWATTDDPVEYTGNMLIFDGDERLGPVPNLALCRYAGDQLFTLFHCDEFWNVIGCSGFSGMEELKAHAEIIYRNITAAWHEITLEVPETGDFVESLFEEDACLFCACPPEQVGQLFGDDNGFICDACVVAFNQQLEVVPTPPRHQEKLKN